MAKRTKKKEMIAKVKFQVPGGKATPAPPVSPALGQHGANIGQFVQQFNATTTKLNGMLVTVVVTIYKDKSFTYEVKSPPASVLLKEAAGLAKGSGVPNREKVGKITREQLRSIAERKRVDLNAKDDEGAERIVAGSARSMGIEIAN